MDNIIILAKGDKQIKVYTRMQVVQWICGKPINDIANDSLVVRTKKLQNIRP